mmetsp:Transcript_15012/g.41522  ORF Transcript_15012/g.41522 Transcript_15012/m.41522 type:complete len:1279 (-) Transcript_15012:332-4168(-)
MMRRSQAHHQGTLQLPNAVSDVELILEGDEEEEQEQQEQEEELTAEENPEQQFVQQQRLRFRNSSNSRRSNNTNNDPSSHRLHPRSSGSSNHITAARRRHSNTNPNGTATTNINASYYGMELEEQQKVEQDQIHTLVKVDTRAIRGIKILTAIVLVLAAILLSLGTFWLVQEQEQEDFEVQFHWDAQQIVQHFVAALYQKLLAIDKLAIAMTSHALQQQQQFPNVTLPHFEVFGSAVRVAAHAMIIHWMPMVYDQDRAGWEAYALQHRFHIDEAFASDEELRQEQDQQFGYGDRRYLQQQQQQQSDPNVLDDGTGYHPRIWSNAGRGVDSDGSGPYLPLWQRSPINPGKQSLLNLNFANAKVFQWVLSALLASEKVTLAKADVPLAFGQERLKSNLERSQFRHVADEYDGDPITFLAYPVFDRLVSPPRNANDPKNNNNNNSSSTARKMVGVLATNLYWGLDFSRILAPSSRGIICVLENSYNQSLVYRIDGSDARFVGELNSPNNDNATVKELSELHYEQFESIKVSRDINAYIQEQASPENRAYTTVPLNPDFGLYTLKVYPSEETKEAYMTNKPAIYAAVVASIFAFTSCLFILYDYFGERRKDALRNRALENAHLAAVTEREMNEYICHEMRNPLAAAVAACNFVKVKQEEQLEMKQQQHYAHKSFGPIVESQQYHRGPNDEFRNSCSGDAEEHESVLKDIHIIHSSLEIMDSILVGLLDWHHAQRLQDNNMSNRTPIDVGPEEGSSLNDTLSERAKCSFARTNILNDIFRPISAMLNNTSKARLVLSRRHLDTGDLDDESSGSIDEEDLFQFLIECPSDLEVNTDMLRLKQVIYNLAKNATQYVMKTEHSGGFVRLRAEVEYERSILRDEPIDEEIGDATGKVVLYVEDSGQSVQPTSHLSSPRAQRRASIASGTSNISNPTTPRLRNRFGRHFSDDISLHSSSQAQETVLARRPAAGASLTLCKDLVALLGGHLWLDESYDSGIPGFAGVRFVVQLNMPSLQSVVDVDTMFDDTKASNEEVIIFDASTRVNADATGVEEKLFSPDASTEASSSDKESHSNKSSLSNTSQEEISENEVMGAQKSASNGAASDSPAAPPPPNSSSSTEKTRTRAIPSPPTGVARKKTMDEKPCQWPEDISVLFVDDDVILRKLFTRSLKRVAPSSWTIEQAESGEEAIERILTDGKVFQLIFMDQYMPAPKGSTYQPLLGSETTRKLRSRGVDADTTIICGLSANDVEQQFINAGASSFTRKPLPCKKDELTKLLESLLLPPSS